jgi:hypothetical protein
MVLTAQTVLLEQERTLDQMVLTVQLVLLVQKEIME